MLLKDTNAIKIKVEFSTFDRSVKVALPLAEAALVVCHDEDAVDVLHPVEVEGPVAVEPVTSCRNSVSIENR